MAKPRYKLTLSALKFVSAVDMPAQESATVAIIKRASSSSNDLVATFAIAKLDDELGIVMGFALTTTVDGKPYFDLQGDAIQDEDLVKVAAEFMAAGGPTDAMHDEQQDGKVVFCWPLTGEIAKSLDIKTSKTGLLVGIKPSPDVLEKFRSGEYTGFSIGGTGTREAVKRAPATLFPRVAKVAALTDEIDGHAHVIDLEDPLRGWSSYQTSYQTADGADGGHSHAWTFDALTRVITIAADSGHTHVVAALVPMPMPVETDVDAVPEPITDEKSSGATVVVINARAPTTSKSTHPTPTAKVGSQGKETAMDPKDQKISELEKMIARLTKSASMTDAQRAHHATLATDDAEAFLAKSTAERETIVASISDVAKAAAAEAAKVEYVSPVDGTVYRKSDDPRLVAMAKREAASVAASEQVSLEKRADEVLKHFGKPLTIRAAILKAVNGIVDEVVRKDAIEALKGADAALAELIVAKGINPLEDAATGSSPVVAFNKALGDFAKTTGKPVAQATGEFLRTEIGAELYAAAYPVTRN